MHTTQTDGKINAQDALNERGFDVDVRSVLRDAEGTSTLLDLYFPEGCLGKSKMGRELAEVSQYHAAGDYFTDGSNNPLCSLFTVYGEAVDPMTGDRVLYIRHIEDYRRPVTTRVPYNDIAAGGASLAKTLSNAGLWVTSTKKGRESLAAMLAAIKPPRLTLATSYGWLPNRNAFALGGEVYGAESTERIHVDNAYVGKVKLARRGTLADWSSSVGKYAARNSRLIFALGMAVTSPLLRFVAGQTSFVANLCGDSSVGKSTALNVFGSVWGGSEGGLGFNHAWDMTDKDAAKKAAAHSYIGLGLDEQGQMGGDPAKVAYSIASGIERGRLNKDSSEREQATWRVAVLSTGERSISEIMEAKNPRDRQASGVEVRNFDVPADTGLHGIFDELHGFTDGRGLAEHLADATNGAYGTAGPAFVEQLVRHVSLIGSEAFSKELRAGVDEFLSSLQLSDAADASVRRIARQFALAAVAARLAVRFGVFPLEESEAFDGVRKCFNDWLRVRGSVKSLAKISDLIAVRDFLQSNGGKFARIPSGKPSDAEREAFEHATRNGSGLGFRLTAKVNRAEKPCFGITAAGWKSLRLARGNALGQLEDLGLIERGLDPKHAYQKQVRLPDNTRQWFYVIDAAALEISDSGHLEPDVRRSPLPMLDDNDNVIYLETQSVAATLHPAIYGRDTSDDAYVPA
jgi:putative DNA primase/helicase